MNATDPTSLTPQERELAQQLAQVGPSGEPSPALDARILAAAREAGVSPSSTSSVPKASFSKSISRPRRIRRRWPIVLGVAASMVLALGVAWRMQPLPEARQIRSSDATPAMRAAITSPQIAIEPPVENPVDTTPSKAQIQNAITSPARARITQADESETAPASPTPAEPSIVRDAPSPQDALQAAAKAAHSVLRTRAPQVSGTMAESAAVTPPPSVPNAASQADMAADSRQNPAQQADSNPSKSTVRYNAAARDDEPLNDVPPATADAPAVRDAWLQRIRSLLGDGYIADARLSLHAFLQRYPTYPLPEDLRPLAKDSTNPP